MPGIDGYETCRRLKDDPDTRDAAVIFLSALDDAKDKVRGFEAGAVDFVTKPFQGDEVLARVHTHLSIQRLLRRQHEDTSATTPPVAQDDETGVHLGHDPQSASDSSRPHPAPAATEPGRSVFRTGDVVAYRFRIVRYLAKGGMGELYEAEDLELHERVALKTILSSIADDERSILLFKREVHLARQVTHANVCRIFDVFRHRPAGDRGSAGEVVFLAMELLHGETLADRLARDGRLSTTDALPLVRQMAAGLAAAHRVGVVHRDFKSHNVMLVEPTPPDRGAAGRDHGFRAGASQRARRSDQSGLAERRERHLGDTGLHGAGAGGGRAGDAGHGHLCARGRAVRDGHRHLAVHGRDAASHSRQTAAGVAPEPAHPRARPGPCVGGDDSALSRSCAGRPLRHVGDVVAALEGGHRQTSVEDTSNASMASYRIVGACRAPFGHSGRRTTSSTRR